MGQRSKWAQGFKFPVQALRKWPEIFCICKNKNKNKIRTKTKAKNPQNLTQIIILWNFMAWVSKNQTPNLNLWVVEFQLKLNYQFIIVPSVKASSLLKKNEVLITGIGSGGDILMKL